MNIWIGNYGEYLIPDQFSSIRICKDGWPDKRSSLYKEFMSWVRSVDKP